MSYILNFWNYFDIALIACNTLFVLDINILRSQSNEAVRKIASIGMFLMWLKFFYWLRTFKATSMFIRLVVETIKDIGVFMLVFALSVVAFANILLLFSIERKNTDDTDIDEVFTSDLKCEIIDDEMQCKAAGNEIYNKTFNVPFLDSTVS